jgi:hypothetical protein
VGKGLTGRSGAGVLADRGYPQPRFAVGVAATARAGFAGRSGVGLAKLSHMCKAFRPARRWTRAHAAAGPAAPRSPRSPTVGERRSASDGSAGARARRGRKACVFRRFAALAWDPFFLLFLRQTRTTPLQTEAVRVCRSRSDQRERSFHGVGFVRLEAAPTALARTETRRRGPFGASAASGPRARRRTVLLSLRGTLARYGEPPRASGASDGAAGRGRTGARRRARGAGRGRQPRGDRKRARHAPARTTSRAANAARPRGAQRG